MATLDDIQEMVKVAQVEAKKEDHGRAMHIWSEIRNAVRDCSDINNMKDRKNLEILIHEALDKQNLQSAKPESIDVGILRLKAASSLQLAPPTTFTWLPY